MKRSGRSVVGLVAALATAVALWPDWGRAGRVVAGPRRELDALGTDAAVATVVQLLAFAACCWLVVGLAALALTALPVLPVAGRARTDAVARRVLPAGLYRLVAGAAAAGILGASMGAGAATAAGPTASVAQRTVGAARSASPGPAAPAVPVSPAALPGGPAVPRTPTALPGGPAVPTTPTALPGGPANVPPRTARPSPGPTPSSSVTVRPGDCLWLIAARRLTDEAAVHDLVAATERLYAANRSVIGDDPALIRPGQVLTVPGNLANGESS